MKENINSLGGNFERVILECKNEEEDVRTLEKKYSEALDKLHKNNVKRIDRINRIRLDKISEIDHEITISTNKLTMLKAERQELLEKYCEKNGHSYVLTKTRFLGFTDNHSFKYGRESIRRNEYQCEVCGKKSAYNGSTYIQSRPKDFKLIIPPEAYGDNFLSGTTGRNMKIIDEEIQKNEEYINYLKYLKRGLCLLFGHDVEKVSDNGYYTCFLCKCCGEYLYSSEYRESYHSVIYKGIVPYYYDIPEVDYITPSENELYGNLPTYENYKKALSLSKNKTGFTSKK